jgi:hypothetical protein
MRTTTASLGNGEAPGREAARSSREQATTAKAAAPTAAHLIAGEGGVAV